MEPVEAAKQTLDPRPKRPDDHRAGVGDLPDGNAGALAELRKHVLPKDYPELISPT